MGIVRTIEECLENNGGGDLIYVFPPRPTAGPGLEHHLFGDLGGKSLIDQMDREAARLPQLFGKVPSGSSRGSLAPSELGW